MRSITDPVEIELNKAYRKATHLFVRKKYRGPVGDGPVYKAPPPGQSEWDCPVCKRPIWSRCGIGGNICRECFGKRSRAKHEARVRAEDERVRRNEEVFNSIIKKGNHMAKSKQVPAPVIRSTSGLREVIFEEMEALRNGDSSPQRARSMAAMANSILQSVEVEIEYHKYVSSNRRSSQVDGEKKVVELGTDIKLVAAA